MGDLLYLYNYLMDALFIGFGFVTVALLLPFRFYGKELQIHIGHLITSITKLMPIVALLYLLVSFAFVLHNALDQDKSQRILDSFQGTYAIAYSAKAFLIPLIILLFWIKRIAASRRVVFFIAVVAGFFYIVMNERFVIFLISIHRDYLPDNWNGKGTDYEIFYFFGRFLLEQLTIFCVLVIPFHFFRIKKLTGLNPQN